MSPLIVGDGIRVDSGRHFYHLAFMWKNVRPLGAAMAYASWGFPWQAAGRAGEAIKHKEDSNLGHVRIDFGTAICC